MKYLLKTGIPMEILILSLILTTIFINICYFSKYNGVAKSIKVILAEYVFILICSTIIFRPNREKIEYNFQPLWTYVDIFAGRTVLIPEVLLNIFLFIPLGGLTKAAFPQKGLGVCLLFGCLFSSLIEIFQLLLQKGFCELDDIIHNSIGFVIGYYIYKVSRMVYNIYIQK